jgi:dethiobiotin synthetase
MKPIADIIVVGTDTGVGKSVVSLLLMQLLFARGYSPFYIKPFQTGCRSSLDTDSDAMFVYSHTKALEKQDPGQSVLYCHPNPKAPYFAARDANLPIDPAKVCRSVDQLRLRHNPLILEAAGGLLVPVLEEMLLVDLIKPFACRPLLVARAGLGTINHTLLSIEALHSRQIMPMGIVFVEASAPPTDPDLVSENLSAVEKFAGCRVSGVIPRLSDFHSPPSTAYRPLETILFDGH